MTQTNTNGKLRAVFLAALMFLWVFAGTMAFAGGAAAATNVDNADADPLTVGDSAATHEVTIEGVTADGTGNVDIIDNTLSDESYIAEPTSLSVVSSDFDSVSVVTGENFGEGTNTGTGEARLEITTASGEVTGDITVEVVVDTDSNTDLTTTSVGTIEDAYTVDAVNNGQVNADVEAVGFNVEDLDAPRVAPHGEEIDVTATINSSFSEETTQTISYFANNGGDAAAGTEVDTQEVTIAAGGEQTVTFTVDTSTLPASSPDDTINYEHGVFSENNGAVADLSVGSDDTGSITVNLQDRAGEPIDQNLNPQVELSFDGTVIRTAEGDSTVTFDNLAVGDVGAGTGAISYGLVGNAERFESAPTEVSLFRNDPARANQISQTETITLADASNPNVLGVNAFDADNEDASGETAAIFANEQFDSQGDFVVFTQNQFGEALSGDQQVEVTIDPTGGDNPPLLLVDDQDNETTTDQPISRVIDADSPTASLDGNESTEFSYITFSATADEASEDNVGTFSEEDITVTSSDIETQALDGNNDRVALSDLEDVFGENQVDDNSDGTGAEVSATAFYFVEGDQTVTGDVRVEDGGDASNDNRENVTVYAAYPGLSDKTIEAIGELQNDEGESFLVDESGPDGYQITGLAGDNTEFELFAVEDGFNSFQTDNNDGTRSFPVNGIDENVAYYKGQELIGEGARSSTLQTPPTSDTVTQDVVLKPEVQEYDIDVTVDDGSGDFVKETRLQDSQATTVQVEVDARPFNDDEASFEDAPEGTTVDLEALLLDDDGNIVTEDGDRVAPESGLVNDNDQVVVEESVELDANGTATTTFQADEEVTELVNVTANVTNADGVVFSTLTDDGAFADDGDRSDAELDGEVINSEDGPAVNTDGSQAQIQVFESGSITGDVVDEEDENVPNADVTLSVEVDVSADDEPEELEYVPANESDLFADDFQATRNTGDDGSYAFTGLPTGENYRVDAEANVTNADGEEVRFTGRNTEERLIDLRGGTTGGVGVVLTDLVLGDLPDPNPDPGTDLTRFDTNGNNAIDFQEVIDAIGANNEDTEIGGEPVTFDDVIAVIEANNEGTAVVA